jgi:hypothetical protein
MMQGFGDNRAIIAILAVVAVMTGILAVWQMQANRMERDFVDAIRAGRVRSFPIDLRDKTWTDAELATAEVIKLDQSAGRERALVRLAHTGGGYTLSSARFSYQAVVTDTSGIKHVFGYRRADPGGWTWETIHPDSAQQHLQQRFGQAGAVQ